MGDREKESGGEKKLQIISFPTSYGMNFELRQTVTASWKEGLDILEDCGLS